MNAIDLINATMAKRQSNGLKLTITKGTHPQSGLDVSGHTRFPANLEQLEEIKAAWVRKGYEFVQGA